jgi:hypothetical protein
MRLLTKQHGNMFELSSIDSEVVRPRDRRAHLLTGGRGRMRPTLESSSMDGVVTNALLSCSAAATLSQYFLDIAHPPHPKGQS